MMLKKIPGNLEYLINIDKQIYNTYGKLIKEETKYSSTFKLELFGKVRKVTTVWLSLLAWYETGYMVNLHEHLDKIKFSGCDYKFLSIRCGFMMSFTEPIYFKDGFRYIPCFPRYAINLRGDVIDTFTNMLVTNKGMAKGYEVIYIYNPDKIGYKNVRLHRLLALAWLPNSDYINKPVVNHLDGVRSNNKLENLEWCSQAENANHALDTGLVKNLVKMKSRDIITGEVVVYKSAADMSRILGMTGVSADRYMHTLPNYVYKKRYEIKLFSDNTPWVYEDVDISKDGPSKSIYTITVLDKKTGEERKFNNVNKFYKTYFIWSKVKNLEAGVAEFIEKYKDHEISYKRNAVAGPYRVVDLETGQIKIFEAIWRAGEYIGRTRTEVQFDLSRGLKFIYSKKWLIATGVDEIRLEDYREKPKPFVDVVITNAEDGKELTVKSIKYASRITGITGRTITKYMNTGKAIKGLSFRTLE